MGVSPGATLSWVQPSQEQFVGTDGRIKDCPQSEQQLWRKRENPSKDLRPDMGPDFRACSASGVRFLFFQRKVSGLSDQLCNPRLCLETGLSGMRRAWRLPWEGWAGGKSCPWLPEVISIRSGCGPRLESLASLLGAWNLELSFAGLQAAFVLGPTRHSILSQALV